MRKLIQPLLLTIIIFLLLMFTQFIERNLPGNIADNIFLLPELIPPPGFYQRTIMVRMQPSHPQGKIIFTTDGSMPSPTSGTLYTHPIQFDNAFPRVITIRAVEVVGDNISPVVTASYALGLDDAIPVVVITAEPFELWDVERGIFANPDRRGAEWERRVVFSVLNKNNNTVMAQTGGIRIVGEPLLSHDKHNFRIYFRTDYDNARLDFNPFRDDASQMNKNLYKRLLLQASRDMHNVNLIKEQLVVDILTQYGMPAAQSRIIHLIINGDSWGLYRLTERIDDVFLEDNYAMFVADIVQDGNAREGTDDGWNMLLSKLMDSVVFSDYDVINSHINIENYIIMSCIQKFFQLPSDAFYAVKPQGGKWFWIYEGGGIKSTTNNGFTDIYNALSKNETFKKLYATQCGNLLNTELSSESIAFRYTNYIKLLSPYFIYEQIRWSNTPPLDILSSQQMDNLMQREFHTRAELAHELSIPGISTISIKTIPENSGFIYISGKKFSCAHSSELCQNEYFNGIDIQLVAVPKSGAAFSHWEFASNDTFQNIPDKKVLAYNVMTNTSITAFYSRLPDSVSDTLSDDVHINEYWINDNGTRYASVGYRAIQGDWIELLVEKPTDIRRWRITDNDTKTGTNEGSIFLPDIDTLASVPKGTVILLITTLNNVNDENFPADDLSVNDKQIILYVGNGNLDTATDPGFDITPDDDNVALMAPGEPEGINDDYVIDFISEGPTVTAYSFGALNDGVTFDLGFSRLGNDDGAILTVRGGNDNLDDWVVDPDSCLSGDLLCGNTRNIVTPGRINPGQSPFR